MPSPSGRRRQVPVRKNKPTATHQERGRTPLSRELEDLRLRELELKKKLEERQRQVEDLPKKIEETERKERELIRIRAVAMTNTADGFRQPRDKRHTQVRSSGSHRRRTRPEERSARIQLAILCVIFAAVFFLLCKSLPH